MKLDNLEQALKLKTELKALKDSKEAIGNSGLGFFEVQITGDTAEEGDKAFFKGLISYLEVAEMLVGRIHEKEAALMNLGVDISKPARTKTR